MVARKGGQYSTNAGTVQTKPDKRSDGEMYKRPEPNPFHYNWCEGYDDGLVGVPRNQSLKERPEYYSDGYICGEKEREMLDRLGSSNA